MSAHTVLAAAVATSCTLIAACSADVKDSLRADDRECEVVVAQQLHAIVDLWETRFGVVVWCRSAGVDSEQRRGEKATGEIAVTVSPANGQAPVSSASARDAEEQLRASLESTVKREGWASRYAKLTLQVVP